MSEIKPYCTQNNGDCETCSLVNYGRDCKNNPLSIKPRSHFKGRGKTERPTCPYCQEDLKRSYTYEKNEITGKWKFKANGWECKLCKYKQWD